MLQEKLKAAVLAAKEAAMKVSNPNDDWGTCNFDKPYVDLSGFSRKEINKAIEVVKADTGIRIEKGYGIAKGHHFVYTPLDGQGMNRTRMAEAAADAMESAGFKAYVFYQMD